MRAQSSVTVLDGHDSIGGTKILLSTGAERVLLDFGTNFRRMGTFYEEFLHPRPTRGLTDLLEVGLLPRRRGFYRSDLLPPGDYPRGDAEFEGEGPTAVFLTHAHLDHCGALAYLDPSIPVYLTPASLAILRAWQETTKPDLFTEITYYTERRTETGALLGTERGSPRRRRPFRLLGEPVGDLASVLSSSPSKRLAIDGPLPGSGAGDGPVRALNLHALTVDHSLYGSVAFVADVDGARVAYTGDVRFHGERGRETESFLRELERRAPDVLLVEGTRLLPAGATADQPITTEVEVARRSLATVQEYAGRLVVADFGPRNIERLKTFREVAQSTDRELVVTGKDAYLLALLARAVPGVPTDFGPGRIRIWSEPTVRALSPWEERVDAWFPDAVIGPDEIVRHPGRHLLCFSFFDANDLVDLRAATPGGLWLYSSSEAHGEEQEFDFHRLQNWIAWAGMHQVGFHYDPSRDELTFEPGYHASGHATQAELLEFVRRSNARRIVPVHSETPGRYRELLGPEGARVELPVPGRALPLA